MTDYGEPRRSLILGGARSGKSARALEIAAQSEAPRVFVATAQAYDDEMRERIARHRTERGADWQTVEAPLALAEAIESAGRGVLLVDCCTLWLSNVMLAERDAEAATERLAGVIETAPGRIILVSNEVGQGIVPETPLGRRFRDAHGRMNQRLARVCDRVELVVAGLPLRIKG